MTTDPSCSQIATMDSNTPEANVQKLPERNKPPKAKKEKTPKPPKGPTPPKAKRDPAAKAAPDDPDSMFKVGFLAEVYEERPIKPEGISKVVTRCMSVAYVSQEGEP